MHRLVINSYKIIIRSARNRIVFVILSLALLGFYYLALTRSVSLPIFIESNSPIFIGLQIILSIINSILGAASIILLLELLKLQKLGGKLSFIQTVSSLFISIATTGCYVCGSIFLPSLGIASGFAALPIGGLEVKIITILLLIFSINDLTKKLLGICIVYEDYMLVVKLDENEIKFNLKHLFALRPALITGFLILLIFILPLILPKTSLINSTSIYSCKHTVES